VCGAIPAAIAVFTHWSSCNWQGWYTLGENTRLIIG